MAHSQHDPTTIVVNDLMEKFPALKLKKILSITITLFRALMIAGAFYYYLVDFTFHSDNDQYITLGLLAGYSLFLLIELSVEFWERPNFIAFFFVVNILELVGAIGLRFVSTNNSNNNTGDSFFLYIFIALHVLQFLFELMFLLDLFALNTLIRLYAKNQVSVSQIYQQQNAIHGIQVLPRMHQ